MDSESPALTGMFAPVTCKAHLQFLALVGNDVVIGWNKGAAGTVQAEFEPTVSA